MSLGCAKCPEGPLARLFRETGERFAGCFGLLAGRGSNQDIKKARNSWLLLLRERERERGINRAGLSSPHRECLGLVPRIGDFLALPRLCEPRFS